MCTSGQNLAVCSRARVSQFPTLQKLVCNASKFKSKPQEFSFALVFHPLHPISAYREVSLQGFLTT